MKCQRRRIPWIQSIFSQPVLCTSEQHRETQAARTRPVGLWIRWWIRSQLIDTWNEICCFQGHLNGKQSEGCMSISRRTVKNELIAIFGGSFSHNLMISCQDFSVFVFQFCHLFYIIYTFSSLLYPTDPLIYIMASNLGFCWLFLFTFSWDFSPSDIDCSFDQCQCFSSCVILLSIFD